VIFPQCCSLACTGITNNIPIFPLILSPWFDKFTMSVSPLILSLSKDEHTTPVIARRMCAVAIFLIITVL
jgi:hypothetical protein